MYGDKKMLLASKSGLCLLKTFRRNLTQRGIAHCELDKLDSDVLHNHILKPTLHNLSLADELDKEPSIGHRA